MSCRAPLPAQPFRFPAAASQRSTGWPGFHIGGRRAVGAVAGPSGSGAVGGRRGQTKRPSGPSGAVAGAVGPGHPGRLPAPGSHRSGRRVRTHPARHLTTACAAHDALDHAGAWKSVAPLQPKARVVGVVGVRLRSVRAGSPRAVARPGFPQIRTCALRTHPARHLTTSLRCSRGRGPHGRGEERRTAPAEGSLPTTSDPRGCAARASVARSPGSPPGKPGG